MSSEHLYGLPGYIYIKRRVGVAVLNPKIIGKVIMKRQVVICVIVSLLGTAMSDSEWIGGMTGSESYEDLPPPMIGGDQATVQTKWTGSESYILPPMIGGDQATVQTKCTLVTCSKHSVT